MADNGNYGGFWIRFVALLADSAIVFFLAMLIVVVATFLGDAGAFAGSLLIFLLYLLYWPVMHASARQATLGKAMLGMKVVEAGSGARLSFLRSLGRELAKIISSAVFMIGFLIAAFTRRKQALHDLIASTVVVREGRAHVVGALAVAVAGFVLPVVAVPVLIGGAMIGMMGNMLGMGEAPKPPVAAQQFAKPRPAQPKPPAARAPAAAPKREPVQVAKAAPTPAATPAQAKSGTVVIPGTWMWDAEHNAVGSLGGVDLWWQQRSPTERFLSPRQGAAIAPVQGAKYEALDAAALARLAYTSEPISGSDTGSQLEPGAVVALRTGEGNLVKLKVVRYRNSHDVAFPGSEVLSAAAKETAGKRPPIAKYNIELEWTLYPGQAAGTMVAAAPSAPAAAPAPAAPRVPAPPAPKPAEAPKAAEKPAPAMAAAPKPEPKVEPKESAAAAPKSEPKPAARAPAKAAAAPKPAPARPKVAAAAPAPKPAASAPQQVAAAAAPVPAPEPVVITPKYNDLMTAVLYRDLAGVQQLLALGRWVDKPDSRGATPLIAAAQLGEIQIAEALLKAGADPNASARNGDTAHSVAVARSDSAFLRMLERHTRR
jgi:uncharacterized RDD family membrane protein YckC